MGKYQEQNQRPGLEQLPAGWNRAGKAFQGRLFSTSRTSPGVSESDSLGNVCDKQREDRLFQTQSRWRVQVQWMWETEKLGGQMDLQIGDLPWAIWLERTWRDEKKDKGWLLNNGGQIGGWKKKTRVRVGSLWLDEKQMMFEQWQSALKIWLGSQAMFSTIGKAVQMWRKNKFELLWQRNSNESFDITQSPSRGDNFCKLFLSVLKSGYISAVQFYFCLCDQALWSEI